MDNNKTEIWKELHNQKSIWECISVDNYVYYFEFEGKKIPLRNFKSKYLPDHDSNLTFLGRFLTKFSTCSNLMSRKPGSQDVTLYCMMKKPHGSFIRNKIDEKFLETAAPPISWRREAIIKKLDDLVYEYAVEKNDKFAFLDIGSGGGFDGLEIDRLMIGLSEDNLINTEDGDIPFGQDDPKYKIVNIEIDDVWISTGEALCKKLYGKKSKSFSLNYSIFKYLECERYKKDLAGFENLIISCNGFAEFLEDDLLVKLYMEIYDLTRSFKGQIDLILPYAIRSKKQEKLGNLIGFNYLAREKNYMLRLCSLIFPGFEVSYEEQHSQIVLMLRRKAKN